MFTEYGKLVKILNSRSKNAIDPHKIGLEAANLWYETLKCAIFDEVRKQRPEFTDLEILRGLEDGRIKVACARNSNWPFGKPYIPPDVKIEA
jgi:hypothetical protein